MKRADTDERPTTQTPDAPDLSTREGFCAWLTTSLALEEVEHSRPREALHDSNEARLYPPDAEPSADHREH